MILERKQVLAAEQNTGKTEKELMETAGIRCAGKIFHEYADNESFIVCCGKGNNAGDGFVIARQCLENDREVCVVLMMDEVTSETAQQQLDLLKDQCRIIKLSELSEHQFHSLVREYDVLIDCIFGFSFHAPLSEVLRPYFKWINQNKITTVSIDINSGLECDNCYGDPDALHSDLTLALGCLKPVHCFDREHGKMDKIHVIDMGFNENTDPTWYTVDALDVTRKLPRLKTGDYKNSTGTLGVIAGSPWMAGAALFNLEGACAMGCGMIHAMVDPMIYPILQAECPHVVYHPFSPLNPQLIEFNRPCDALALGCGSDHQKDFSHCLDILLRISRIPMVLDAYALRCLAKNMNWLKSRQCSVILTPHLGEFADLCGCSVEEADYHQIEYARKLASTYQVVIVLKGADTLICEPNGRICINKTGNPSLAKGGSGDLLTGIIAALLAKGLSPVDAACCGVWLHGKAADLAMEKNSLYSIHHKELLEGLNQFLLQHQKEIWK